MCDFKYKSTDVHGLQVALINRINKAKANRTIAEQEYSEILPT